MEEVHVRGLSNVAPGDNQLKNAIFISFEWSSDGGILYIGESRGVSGGSYKI